MKGSKEYKPWSREELLTLQSLINEGKLYSEIAEIMKRPPSTVRKKAQDHGFNVNYALAQRYRRGIETEEKAKQFLYSRGFTNLKHYGGRHLVDYEATKDGRLYGIGVSFAGSTYLAIRASTLQRMCEKYEHVAFVVETPKQWYLLEVVR